METKQGTRNLQIIGGANYWRFLKSNSWMADFPMAYYMHLTGPNENMEYAEKVTPYTRHKGFFYLLRPLEALLDKASGEAFSSKVEKGEISDGLKEILQAPLPEIKDNYYKTSLSDYVKDCVAKGKLDFKEYAGEEDMNRWLAQQYFHLSPIPAALMLNNESVATASGTPTFEKDFYNFTKETVETFLNDNEGMGMTADELNAFANLVEEKYKTNVKKLKDLPPFWQKLYQTEAEAGFFVDPARGKIYDMRPYFEEINRLFAPGWEPLKVYVRNLRKSVKAVLKEFAKRGNQQIDFLKDPFVLMYNEAITNELMRINTYGIKKNAVVPGSVGFDEKSKKKSGKNVKTRYFMPNLFAAEWQYSSGDTVITIPMRDENGKPILVDEAKRGKHSPMPIFVGATGKLLCYVLVLFTRQNRHKKGESNDNGTSFRGNLIVHSTVDDFMAVTKKKMTPSNKKKVTRVLKEVLKDLPDIYALRNSETYKLEKMRPFPGVKLDNGEFSVEFSSTFAKYMVETTGFTVNLPVQLLALDERNPNLLPLGYKLSVYRSMENNIRLGKANIISVETCLENCPGIPAIETVRANGGSPYQKIIEPFEKVMDELKKENLLEYWEYCLGKGETLEDPAVVKYNYFVQLYIKFEIKDFPQDVLETRVKEKDEQAAAKKKRMESMIERNVARNVANKITDQMAAQKK